MDQLALFRTMYTIRHVEERLADLFASSEIPGFLHLSIGQEAIAAGVASALRPSDTVASTHRGHGHCIAKGVDLVGFFAEIFGREAGLCRGRGGSMHVADMSIGMLGANGIVGAGLPLGLGSALAHKVLGTDQVAVVFFGDGAQAEGSLHETLNLGATWRVPLILVCENNGWSEFTPGERAFAGTLEGLAGAFGLDFRSVDGNDVAAVAEVSTDLVARARNNCHPIVLEARTHRVHGHFAGDPQRYRSSENRSEALSADPLVRFEQAWVEQGGGTAILQDIRNEVADQVQAAIDKARASGEPEIDSFHDIYATKQEHAHA